MNIFKKFKKVNKYKELERLFDEIVILFPDGSVNIMIHRIDFKKLDKRIWQIKSNNTAKRRNNKIFDITLFGKDK